MKKTNTKKLIIGMMALMLAFGTLGNTAKSEDNKLLQTNKKKMYQLIDFKDGVIMSADAFPGTKTPIDKIKIIDNKIITDRPNNLNITNRVEKEFFKPINVGDKVVLTKHIPLDIDEDYTFEAVYAIRVDKVEKNYRSLAVSKKRPIMVDKIEGTIIPLSEVLKEVPSEGNNKKETSEETKKEGKKKNTETKVEDKKVEETKKEEIKARKIEDIATKKDEKKIIKAKELEKSVKKELKPEKEIKVVEKKEVKKETPKKEEVKKESKKENPNTGDAGSLTAVMSAVLSAVTLFVSRKRK